MDSQNKGNKSVLFLLVLFIIISVLLSGYIIYDKILNKPEEKTSNQTTNIDEKNFIRKTSLVLVEEPVCTGASSSLEAEINESKNIAISQNLGAEEIVVGNAKYLFSVGQFACDNVDLYYITENDELFIVKHPTAGKPNQKGIKVSSSKIIEFLGTESRDDGSYLKVLRKDNTIEYIKYFTAPGYFNNSN